jgi:hypothetical protein
MMQDAARTAALPALGDVLHLERRAYGAASREALGFTIVNETSVLAPYRQAALFEVTIAQRLSLSHASGLVSVSEDSPYAVWLTQLAADIPTNEPVQRLEIEAVPAPLAEGWHEWLPRYLLACNVCASGGERVGLALYARDEPWTDAEAMLLQVMHETYGYCLQSLLRARNPWKAIASRMLQGRWLRRIAIVAALALLVPVRLSAIAPAEIVALSSVAIAAPQDGVIGAIHVKPNATVKAGDRLFSLDDRGLESRREVALRELQIARADLLVAEQRAFDDAKSKGDVASAQGRVKEKEAELALVAGMLDRVTVRAPADGVVVFGDANDWLGRPVQTGERIMQLADPRDAGVLVWLPVADAINLEVGAPIRLFLHTDPLHPQSATLLQTSYQAVQSPANVSAYKVRGRFEHATPDARIGLRGTARVSGEWACLGYYLLRRPIAAVREWTGL